MTFAVDPRTAADWHAEAAACLEQANHRARRARTEYAALIAALDVGWPGTDVVYVMDRAWRRSHAEAAAWLRMARARRQVAELRAATDHAGRVLP